MNLQIFIDSVTQKIIRIEPKEEEFVSKLGDIVQINGKKYSILEMKTDKFFDWELVINQIIVAEYLESEV